MSRSEHSPAGRSPSWKNPRDRLRKHLERTLSNRSLLASSYNFAKTLDTESDTQEVTPESSLTRCNPFKRNTPLKKRQKNHEDKKVSHDFSAELEDTNANDPFSNENLIRDGKPRRLCSRLYARNGEHSLRESFVTDFSDILPSEECASTHGENECCSEKIPLDIRLGTKLRIISRKPFPWMRDTLTTVKGTSPVRITGQERHEGLCNFAKTIATEFSSSSLEISSDVSPMAILESACFSYQFPCFPWLPAYPRADVLISSSAVLNHSIPPLPKQCLDALDMQWTECFDQLFLSWKKGDRRSFYMCCSSFTVLFTKVSLGDDLLSTEDSSSCFQPCGGLRHIVIVTPCSVGFRQYLKNEGIDFEVINEKSGRDTKTFTPSKLSFKECSSNIDWLSDTKSQSSPYDFNIVLKNEPNSSFEIEKTSSENRFDGSLEKADVSGDHEWLDNIEISPRKASKLKRYKSMGLVTNPYTHACHNKLDGGDMVAVLVKGSEVQTLYNLLQSSRVCRSIAGPYANIPPTLISSTPFLHAQLQTLKKTSQTIRKKQLEYVLELDDGPVMPHTIPLVVDFIRKCGLCNEECTLIRVIGRVVCDGLNNVDDELYDWNEIQVERNKIKWRKT